MELFIRRSDGSLMACVGMTQEQVTDMFKKQGFTCEFLTKKEWDAIPKGQ